MARRTHVLAVGLTIGLLSPAAARAAFLSCQAELRHPDCNTATDPLAPPATLHLAASCQECTGGGSDVTCGGDEKATTTSLSLKNAVGAVPVGGSFNQIGTCDFGVPLFRFGTPLGAGTYHVLINIAGHPETLLLAFSVGTTPAGDGGAGQGDAGTGPGGDGGAAGRDATAGTGDGSVGGPGVGDDGGCGCRVAARPRGLGLLALLGLTLWLGCRRSRRRDASSVEPVER